MLTGGTSVRRGLRTATCEDCGRIFAYEARLNTPLRRFCSLSIMERLARRSAVDDATDCRRWLGAHDRKGYGKIGNGHGWEFVHRVAFEDAYGPIPNGLQIDHVRARGCRFRDCWEITHLEAVTPAENLSRGDGPSATRAYYQAQTHCKHGHPLSGGNLYRFVNRRGDECRGCRECRRDNSRRHQAAKSGGL